MFEPLGSREMGNDGRMRKTVAFDVTQDGNRIDIHSDGLDAFFAVEGISLPPNADSSFAIWGLLPLAMGEGFDLRINQPIDPQVAANAEILSRIWEMWVPSRYRSVRVSGGGGWSRVQYPRLPLVQLFSGGIDSTFSVLRDRDPEGNGFAATVCGVDRIQEDNVARLVDKTEPLLKSLDYRRVIIRNSVHREPSALTHGFTLASCLFLLSDLFEEGTIAADSTYAEDMGTFPWGTNHVTNDYFAGSDFSVRTVGADVRRTEKIAAIAAAGLDPHSLSFCRNRHTLPANCGTCRKCTRTKAMFLVATGSIPDIFVDESFNATLMKRTFQKYSDRVHLFDIYFQAKDRGVVNKVPGLAALMEKYRNDEFRN